MLIYPAQLAVNSLSDKCPFNEFFGDSLPLVSAPDILTRSIDEQKRRRRIKLSWQIHDKPVIRLLRHFPI